MPFSTAAMNACIQRESNVTLELTNANIAFGNGVMNFPFVAHFITQSNTERYFYPSL